MNVDLLSLINNTANEVSFEGESSFSDAEFDICWKVYGTASRCADTLQINARADSVVKTKCARCAKPVKTELSVDIAEQVGKDEVKLDGTILDIDSIVKNNIVVELPIRFLCKNDCKGICSICGADLNITECGCSHEQFDERLAVLKQLLDSGNEPE